MTRRYSLDLETELISKKWIAPPPVVLSTFGEDRHDLTFDFVTELQNHFKAKNTLIWHNASFDMSVLFMHFPELRKGIWDAYMDGRIRCTKIREALLHLSVVGHLQFPKSLAACVDRYYDVDISDSKTDPNAWRLRYAELIGVPLEQWPQEAVDYALSDTEWGMKIFEKQEELANPEGYCSMGTEHLQTVFDFVGRLMTIKGFKVDHGLVLETKADLEARSEEPLAALVEAGFATIKAKGKDAGKVSIKEKLLREYILERYPEDVVYSEPSKSFPNGQVSLSADAVMEYPSDPIIDKLKEYRTYGKLLSTYLPNLLLGPTIHPQFNILVDTGRTSSHGHSKKARDEMFPSENVQNLPRSGNVREAHVARDGYVLVGIDYGHLELDCLAQVTYEMFGESRMLEVINKGFDPHCEMGARLKSIKDGKEVPYEEFYALVKAGDKSCKEFRQMAKAANFGYPGGLGYRKMVDYAKKSYGIENMDEQASWELREIFLKTYPEVQKLFEWYQLQETVDGWGYSSSGRYRAKCGYCDGLNGIGLQSRSADGAKEAGIMLMEDCLFGELQDSFLLAFIHDEYIFEMPWDDRLAERVERAMLLMIDGMQKVLPNVRVTVEADAMERWVKNGPFVYSAKKFKNPLIGV